MEKMKLPLLLVCVPPLLVVLLDLLLLPALLSNFLRAQAHAPPPGRQVRPRRPAAAAVAGWARLSTSRAVAAVARRFADEQTAYRGEPNGRGRRAAHLEMPGVVRWVGDDVETADHVRGGKKQADGGHHGVPGKRRGEQPNCTCNR